ncbi:hypothetical protein GCK72_002398 [Caenorhabditis remanei]|uniref:Uncharacterized protein n=1 Tax=Caenorhabditis remanei TaxID=31234 RepID=A0A6A5HSA1_CAERE|nr:hypothetical protein GCK72_002398 [Caenorhabditis remanei]KAF1770579.1 hypothetical protein GCK72_002398 [Caenorhabditis remanei]
MAFNRSAPKRKQTFSEDDLPLQFVPYKAYKELYDNFVVLISLVNQLRGAIIDSGQNKLALVVGESCELLADMSQIADRLFQNLFFRFRLSCFHRHLFEDSSSPSTYCSGRNNQLLGHRARSCQASR